jgi:hypothetical protein
MRRTPRSIAESKEPVLLTKSDVIKLANKLAYQIHDRLTPRFDDYRINGYISGIEESVKRLKSLTDSKSPPPESLVTQLSDRAFALNNKLGMLMSDIALLHEKCKSSNAAYFGFSTFYEELLAIHKQYEGCKINWYSWQLIVPVGAVILEGRGFGNFSIHIDLCELPKLVKNSLTEPPTALSTLVTVRSDNPIYSRDNGSEDTYHPHVSSSGHVCYGTDATEACYKAFKDFRLLDAIDITKAALSSYVAVSAYADIETWDEDWVSEDDDDEDSDNEYSSCDVCGTREEDVYEADCDHYACSDHSFTCEGCDTVVCQECTIGCPCEKTVCIACSFLCRDCNQRHCSDCKAECRDCGSARRCKDCTSSCTECSGFTCDNCKFVCEDCGPFCGDCTKNCITCSVAMCPKCNKDTLTCGRCPLIAQVPSTTDEVTNVPQEETLVTSQSTGTETVSNPTVDDDAEPDLFGDIFSEQSSTYGSLPPGTSLIDVMLAVSSGNDLIHAEEAPSSTGDANEISNLVRAGVPETAVHV